MALQKTMDVMFVIDATGSMSSTIKAAHDKASQIAVDLRVQNSDIDFKFGSVCYRDPIDCPNDEHQFQDLTSNIDDLVEFFKGVSATGGGDGPEDIYGALKITLEQTSWRTGAKSIIFIADAPAHGHDYCGTQNHEDQNGLLAPLLKKIANRGISFTGMSINGGCDQCLTKMKEDYEQGDGPDFIVESLNLRTYSHETREYAKVKKPKKEREHKPRMHKESGEEEEEALVGSLPSEDEYFDEMSGSDPDEVYEDDSAYIRGRMGKRTMVSCTRQIRRHYRSPEYKD